MKILINHDPTLPQIQRELEFVGIREQNVFEKKLSVQCRIVGLNPNGEIIKAYGRTIVIPIDNNQPILKYDVAGWKFETDIESGFVTLCHHIVENKILDL